MVRDILWFKLLNIGVSGKMFDIIVSMYKNVCSRGKYSSYLSEPFSFHLGVKHGECLSLFLFAVYVNDIENEFIAKGANRIDIDALKIFLLLYADDIVIFADTPEDLQFSLDILYDYCQKWKLKVNIDKSKAMVFRKGGRLRQNLLFKYGHVDLEIVSKYIYLGIVLRLVVHLILHSRLCLGKLKRLSFF